MLGISTQPSEVSAASHTPMARAGLGARDGVEFLPHLLISGVNPLSFSNTSVDRYPLWASAVTLHMEHTTQWTSILSPDPGSNPSFTNTLGPEHESLSLVSFSFFPEK